MPGTVLAHTFSVVPPTTNGPAEVEEFDAPDSLGQPDRQVWMSQAPHAFRAGTLTRAVARSFERYCRMVVLEQTLHASEPGGSDHRGILRQINAYELQFLLTPCGKPLATPKPQAQPETAKSGLSRFRNK